MCDDRLLDAIERLIEATSSDEYEYGRNQTVGGASGLYKTRTPWNTECEYTCVSATATNPGNFLITTNPGMNLPNVTGAASYGLSSSGGESNYIDGTFVAITTTDNYVPDIVWQPLPSPGDVYCLITATNSQCLFVTIAFRRKLQRAIPETPRMVGPHKPTLLRPNRRTMMEGFERGRYPGDSGYAHPIGSIPVISDTSTIDSPMYGEINNDLAPKTMAGSPKIQRRAYRLGRNQ